MATQTETQTLTKFSTTEDNTIDIPRGPVTTTLTFFAPPADGSTPFNYVETAPEGQPQRNYGDDPQQITIHDIRGNESSFSPNKNGFGVVSGISSSVTDFDDEDQVTGKYYPEIESLLLQNFPGSNRVFIFDHTIRKSTPNSKRAPVNRTHIDQTSKAALGRVSQHLGSEAETLLKSRVRLVNVWRPLNGPVVSNPLAVADSTTVSADDLVAVEHRYPTRTGETAGVKHSGKWYYLSGMRNDERLFLQCFDSQDGARTPHSAFVDPRTKEDWPLRESIEVRALVFG